MRVLDFVFQFSLLIYTYLPNPGSFYPSTERIGLRRDGLDSYMLRFASPRKTRLILIQDSCPPAVEPLKTGFRVGF